MAEQLDKSADGREIEFAVGDTILSILFIFLVRREIEHGPEEPPAPVKPLVTTAEKILAEVH
jgi:hypothetical protein